MLLTDLPVEILYLIFELLPNNDTINISYTCNLFNNIYHDLCKFNPSKKLLNDHALKFHLQCDLLASDLINYCQFCKIHNNSYYWMSTNKNVIIACNSCSRRLDNTYKCISDRLKICQYHNQDILNSYQGMCDLCNNKIGVSKNHGKMCVGNGKYHDGREWGYYTCPHDTDGCDEIVFHDCQCSYKIIGPDTFYKLDNSDELELVYDAYCIKHHNKTLYVCKKCKNQYKKVDSDNFIKLKHSKYGMNSCSRLPKLINEKYKI